jgi:hypothetical protein
MERGAVLRTAITAYLGTDHDTTAYVDQAVMGNVIEHALAAFKKKRRLFSFQTSSDGNHSVTCLNCGQTMTWRGCQPERVFQLAEAHECGDVETVAEMEDRLEFEDEPTRALCFRPGAVSGLDRMAFVSPTERVRPVELATAISCGPVTGTPCACRPAAAG